MATLDFLGLGSLFGTKKAQRSFANSKEAYDFVRRVYKETNGPTPELKKMYKRYLDDQGAVLERFDGPNSGTKTAA